MDKIKIGNFLKELREDRGLTQIQLSQKLVEDGGYSDALISKWERGQTLPNIDDLKRLANYFGVSVDEILNGTRNKEEDFEKKYFIYNNEWMASYDSDDLYDIRESQELLIETRFKELLEKMVGDGLTFSEDKEFDFIVTHFYQIFLPAVECKDEQAYRNSFSEPLKSVEDINYFDEVIPGGLTEIKFEIYKQAALMHNTTIDEKVWEINKKFVFTKRQTVQNDISDVIDEAEEVLRQRILTLTALEKDILLTTLQTVNVTHRYGALPIYEKKFNRKYNEEQLTKRAIKLLIEGGAKLNNSLLRYWSVTTWRHDIIHELEELHKNYRRPLLVPVCENGKYHYFIVANTGHNREKLGINNEFSNFDFNDYPRLEKRLFNGQTTICKPYKLLAGGSSEEEAFIFARKQILDLSLSDYMSKRDDAKTQELLQNLDRLSLAELRDEYFPLEYRGEYMDDINNLSSNEIKKKYYLKDEADE